MWNEENGLPRLDRSVVEDVGRECVNDEPMRADIRVERAINIELRVARTTESRNASGEDHFLPPSASFVNFFSQR